MAQLNGSIVDGIIMVTPATVNLPTNYPLVTIDPSDEGNFPAVLATNCVGALDAVRYLIELGHRRIGMIGGSALLLSARQRRQGYEEAHRQADLPILAELYAEGDYSRQTARVGARHLLTLPERPTAIMAANDQSAFAVLEIANELGIRVPDELSVIGFDNTPESAHTSPPLTTVDQSIIAHGQPCRRIVDCDDRRQNGAKIVFTNYQRAWLSGRRAKVWAEISRSLLPTSVLSPCARIRTYLNTQYLINCAIHKERTDEQSSQCCACRLIIAGAGAVGLCRAELSPGASSGWRRCR